MTRLRLATYSELRRIAEASGYKFVRQRGSHSVFQNTKGKIVVIPDHGSQPIVRPLIRKIIRDLGISAEEYRQMLESL